MIPLQITAATPFGIALARGWGPPLDALLASVLWHRLKSDAHAAGKILKYHPSQTPLTLDLPLARCGTTDDWHWMATFADLNPRAGDPDIRWRTSRTDRNRLRQLAPNVTSNVVSDESGRYQRRTIAVIAHPTTSLTWRAVGDPDRIRDLLSDDTLTTIGKHRSVGEGEISHWEVHEAEGITEWEAGHEHEPGVLGRTVPTRCLAHIDTPTRTGAVGIAAIRPPYQNQSSRTAACHPAR